VEVPMCSPHDSLQPALADAVAAEVARQLAPIQAGLTKQLDDLRERTVGHQCAIIIFSGDLDKALAGFVLATGAAAAGMEVSMFFTFWGLSVLKKPGAQGGKKNLKESMFRMITPASSLGLGTSQLNFFGLGAAMLRAMMKEKNIASLEELMDVAREMGVKLMACTMSMDAMGVSKEELLDGIEYGGVAAYMGDASQSRVTLFI
jgi:peroxiredoxin family protein